MATRNDSSGLDAIELAATDGETEEQYMEFYSDSPPTTSAKEVSVPHTVSPGGETYAQPIPKDERKEAEVTEGPKNQGSVRRRDAYESVSTEQQLEGGMRLDYLLNLYCNKSYDIFFQDITTQEDPGVKVNRVGKKKAVPPCLIMIIATFAPRLL